MQDHDIVAVDPVDESVLRVDAARPGTGESVSQLLWLADPVEGASCDVIE